MFTNTFVGERGGLRYHFTLARVVEYGQPGDDIITDTDFLSQARGWYCTRIESIRWPGPAIEIEYETATEELADSARDHDLRCNGSGCRRGRGDDSSRISDCIVDRLQRRRRRRTS